MSGRPFNPDPDPVRWFDQLGHCKCGKAESYGRSCTRCANARIARAQKARAAAAKATGDANMIRLEVCWVDDGRARMATIDIAHHSSPLSSQRFNIDFRLTPEDFVRWIQSVASPSVRYLDAQAVAA